MRLIVEVKDTIQKIKKNKSEIKKELELMANGGSNEMAGVQEKSENCTTNKEDAAKVIQKFEEIIKKSDIVGLAYYQGKIFQKLREENDLLAKQPCPTFNNKMAINLLTRSK